jgi:hypothetical protein
VPEDLEHVSLVDVLARRQVGPLTPPMAQTTHLPLHDLDPGMFERVVVELAWRVENARDVQLYGRSGQAQHGLDIVGTSRSRVRFVYQARRLAALTPIDIRGAVVDYAGPPRTAGPSELRRPRRFDAKRFVLATSAQLDVDTALVDELERLREEYRGDLEIDVYGVEKISHALRDAAGVVAGIFGPEWAKAFCGVEPPPIPIDEPSAYGLLEDPLVVLRLADVDARVQQLHTEQPQQAAQLEQELAEQLHKAGYPGHADLHRHRRGLALRAAGDLVGAFDQLWQQAFNEFERGETRLLGNLEEQLEELQSQLPRAAAARLTVLRCAVEWYGQGSRLPLTVPALQQLTADADPWAKRLTCVVLEQALVDGLYSTDPPTQMVGESEEAAKAGSERLENQPLADAAAWTRALLALAENAGDVPEPVWRARLRCAVADATAEMAHAVGTQLAVDDVYGELVDQASAGRFPPAAAALVHARAARAHALADNPQNAIDGWRRSIISASAAGLYGDVRNAFRAIAPAAFVTDHTKVPDLGQIARALPNRDRLLAGTSDPALTALEAAHRGKLPDAFEDTRRCLWEARLSGHLLEERWALQLFADVLAAANHPAEAVELLIVAGEAKRAANLAASLSTWVDVTAVLASPAPWPTEAAARVVGVQVELIPDAEVERLASQLLKQAQSVLATTGLGPQPALEALKALARFGVRLPDSVADPLLELLSPALDQDSRISDTAVEMVANLYLALPHRRAALAPRLLAATSLSTATDNAWHVMRNLRGQHQPLLPGVRQLAQDGDHDAILTLATWDNVTPTVRRAARQAAANLLRTPVGHPRTMWSMDNFCQNTATLVRALLADGDAADGVTPQDLTPVSQPGPDITHGGELDDTKVDEVIPTVGHSQAGAGAVSSINDENANADTPSVPAEPDRAAYLAAGPVNGLGDAVAAHLLDMADDAHDAAFRRRDTVSALRRLLPQLPIGSCSLIARRLLGLHLEPRLSETDAIELATLDPLYRGSSDTGARTMAALALQVAAEAYARAHLGGADDSALASELVTRSERLLRDDDADIARAAALSLAALAPAAPVDARVLAAHTHERVRAVAARVWIRRGGQPPGLLGRLAEDPSARVRMAVAARVNQSARLAPKEAQNLRQLKNDPSFNVRAALAHPLPEEQP